MSSLYTNLRRHAHYPVNLMNCTLADTAISFMTTRRDSMGKLGPINFVTKRLGDILVY